MYEAAMASRKDNAAQAERLALDDFFGVLSKGQGKTILESCQSFKGGINAEWFLREIEHWLSCARDSDIAEGLYQFGLVYACGVGVEQDDAKAMFFLAKAATHGHPEARRIVASKARQPEQMTLVAVAECGVAEAQFRLGGMYTDGRGVEQDLGKSIEYLEKAAGQGHVEAAYFLGSYLWDKQDYYEKGMDLLKQAAERGHMAANYRLGLINDTRRNHEEAERWLLKAADGGLAEAQNSLGLMYWHGRDEAQDRKKAEKWLRKAASQGYADAQYHLALLQKEKSAPKGAGKTPMHPFNLITSRDTDFFPWEELMEYEHLMVVDWREEEKWIVERFCRASGLPREGIDFTWNDAGDLLRFTYPGGVIDIEQSEEKSSQHSMVAALQAVFGATHSIRYLSHFEGSDTAYFVVETPVTWQYLEANNPYVPWFFTPIEQIPDVFLSDCEVLSAAAERYYYRTRGPDKPA